MLNFRRALSALLLALIADPAIAAPPKATGANSFGQLGDGLTAGRNTGFFIGGGQTFVGVTGGVGHSLGLTAGGKVWSWGHNTSGQLGDGGVVDHKLPLAVPETGVLAGRTALAVAADGDSSFAVLDDGTIAAWGYNLDAELGDGSMTNRPTPVLVSGITTASSVDAGLYHGLAVLSDHTVRAWGYNGQGQLGDNTLTLRTSPVAVSGITTATAVSGGNYHSLALLQDGTVRAWGFNTSGQLGDNSLTQRKVPVPVSGLTDVVQIAAGASHSVARKNDGTVWTWGENGNGELGLGDNTDRSVPHLVPGITTAVEIAANGNHTLVRLADGTVRAFGDNAFGQLGDGSTADRSLPVACTAVIGATGLGSGAFHTFYLVPAPPLVTLSADPVLSTTTTATIKGTVNPSERPTTAKFEYGTSAAFGLSVDLTLSPNDGNTPQNVSADLTNLLPGKTYFYRLSATNAGGTSNTSIGSFTTRSLFTQWRLDKLGDANAPADGDPDADDLENLAEFAFGTEPLEPSTPIHSGMENNRMTITFPRGVNEDATITVQASENLITWSDIASSDLGHATTALVPGVEVTETPAGPVVMVKVRDLQDVTDPAHPKRYLRIQVAN
jgi:hypothetical protein